MADLEQLATDLRGVGLKDREIEQIIVTAKKMEPDSPDKLYYLMNLANVTNMKTIARALIAVYGEEGHEFIRDKVKKESMTSHSKGNQKRWNESVDEVNMDKHLGDMMKAAKMKMMMSAMGVNPDGSNGNSQQQNYAMAEEPFLKDGKFVLDEQGNIVMKKVPVNPNSEGGGMNQMMMMMVMKMFDSIAGQRQGPDEMTTKMFEIIATKAMGGDGDQLNNIYEQMANMKEQLTEKELEMRDKEMQGILRDFAEEIGNLKRSQNKSPIDEIMELKQMTEALGDVGLFGQKKTEEDWKREREMEELKLEREMKDKSISAIRDMVNVVGQPLAGAIGEGIRENMLRRGTEPAPEEVEDMIESVKTQKVMGGGRLNDVPLDDDELNLRDMHNKISSAKKAIDKKIELDDDIEVAG